MTYDSSVFQSKQDNILPQRKKANMIEKTAFTSGLFKKATLLIDYLHSCSIKYKSLGRKRSSSNRVLISDWTSMHRSDDTDLENLRKLFVTSHEWDQTLYKSIRYCNYQLTCNVNQITAII